MIKTLYHFQRRKYQVIRKKARSRRRRIHLVQCSLRASGTLIANRIPRRYASRKEAAGPRREPANRCRDISISTHFDIDVGGCQDTLVTLPARVLLHLQCSEGRGVTRPKYRDSRGSRANVTEHFLVGGLHNNSDWVEARGRTMYYTFDTSRGKTWE